MIDIDWSKLHCGVHQASYGDTLMYIPELVPILETFPDNHSDFIWDVKIHMLMPGQYPCIPNWHYDFVPRTNNVQDFTRVNLDLPMYLWASNRPLPEFRERDDYTWTMPAEQWIRFNQANEHRGTVSREFAWRCLIRAAHRALLPDWNPNRDPLRRHSQVYLDANTFTW